MPKRGKRPVVPDGDERPAAPRRRGRPPAPLSDNIKAAVRRATEICRLQEAKHERAIVAAARRFVAEVRGHVEALPSVSFVFERWPHKPFTEIAGEALRAVEAIVCPTASPVTFLTTGRGGRRGGRPVNVEQRLAIAYVARAEGGPIDGGIGADRIRRYLTDAGLAMPTAPAIRSTLATMKAEQAFELVEADVLASLLPAADADPHQRQTPKNARNTRKKPRR